MQIVSCVGYREYLEEKEKKRFMYQYVRGHVIPKKTVVTPLSLMYAILWKWYVPENRVD